MSLKKLIYLLSLVSAVFSQNFQVHYEAAESRQYLVSTLEMFQPDEYGSTFWFADMEYDAAGNKSMSLAYWEIARYVNLPLKNLSATIQFNDGAATFGNLGQVWLAGLSYYLDLGFFALPVDLLYRHTGGSSSADFQITAAWVQHVMHDKLEFAGFLDLWSQDGPQDGKQWVLLTEPQLWYLAGDHLSLGSELEISYNFIFGETAMQILPTVALRWVF